MGSPSKLRVLVADDHPSVRENLRYLLNLEPDLEVVAVARDGREALGRSLELSPDVAVLDQVMSGLEGIEVALRLRRERPQIHIVLYTSEASGLAEAERIGALFVMKDAPASELLRAVRQAVHLERADLRQAVETDQLSVALQPIVAVRGGKLVRFEALCRWRHSTRGEIDPARFIALAEGGGLITPLTYAVVRKAAAAVRDWPTQDRPRLNINLSLLTLVDAAFPADLQRLLAEVSYPADQLRLEITETTLTREPEAVAAALEKLRESGIRVAIDDFGIGFSSLARLTELPVDAIKIDRHFVGAMTKNRKAHAIVRASIALAHDLGIEAVAEGVEDRETWDLLAALGCDAAQGFFIAHPLDPEAVAGWMGTWSTTASDLARPLRRQQPSAPHEGDVLVVDDEPVLTEMIRDILEQEGFRVVTAANGFEALREVERARPSVVLLDVSMPIVDGPSFAQKLRERGLKVPIVIMTAGSSAVRWAHDLGAEAYLSKPFELSALLQVANRFATPTRGPLTLPPPPMPQ